MTNRRRKERQEKPVSRKAVTPVYNQILVQPVHRGINDIGTWKSALRAADMGPVSYTHLTLPTKA